MGHRNILYALFKLTQPKIYDKRAAKRQIHRKTPSIDELIYEGIRSVAKAADVHHNRDFGKNVDLQKTFIPPINQSNTKPISPAEKSGEMPKPGQNINNKVQNVIAQKIKQIKYKNINIQNAGE